MVRILIPLTLVICIPVECISSSADLHRWRACLWREQSTMFTYILDEKVFLTHKMSSIPCQQPSGIRMTHRVRVNIHQHAPLRACGTQR